MPPQQLTARVEYSRVLAGSCLALILVPQHQMEYKAGQYLSLKINAEGERRSYSLASWPTQEKLELMVDTSPMGKGSQYILGLKPGDEVEILFPMGRFTIEDTLGEPTSNNLVFIATGSGIVPLRSMIHSLLEDKHYQGRVHLHWGMRHFSDLFWHEELKALEARFANFHFNLVLSKPDPNWTGCRGHVNDCLIEEYQTWRGWSAYLCGNQMMIQEVNKLLVSRGITPNQVYFEQFY